MQLLPFCSKLIVLMLISNIFIARKCLKLSSLPLKEVNITDGNEIKVNYLCGIVKFLKFLLSGKLFS